MVAASKPAAPKLLASKVKIYKPEEVDIPAMVTNSRIRLGKTPYEFQKRFFSNVMQGRDVVLDIGTGSGKSLCFDLPVLANKEDIVLVVSPLSALIIQQVCQNCPFFIKITDRPRRLLHRCLPLRFARRQCQWRVRTLFTRYFNLLFTPFALRINVHTEGSRRIGPANLCFSRDSRVSGVQQEGPIEATLSGASAPCFHRRGPLCKSESRARVSLPASGSAPSDEGGLLE